MYLLDTNHCTFLIEGEPKVVNHFRELGKVILATSTIVAGELRFMAQNSQQKTANLIKICAYSAVTLEAIGVVSVFTLLRR